MSRAAQDPLTSFENPRLVRGTHPRHHTYAAHEAVPHEFLSARGVLKVGGAARLEAVLDRSCSPRAARGWPMERDPHH